MKTPVKRKLQKKLYMCVFQTDDGQIVNPLKSSYEYDDLLMVAMEISKKRQLYFSIFNPFGKLVDSNRPTSFVKE